MVKHNFKELKIWQKGLDLVDLSYDFAGTLPNEEKYNLRSQIIRSACSVPSNIAEGSSNRTNQHFSEYLSTSLGSSFELETHLMICDRRNFGENEIRKLLIENVNELKNMIYHFREKLNTQIIAS